MTTSILLITQIDINTNPDGIFKFLINYELLKAVSDFTAGILLESSPRQMDTPTLAVSV